MHTSPRLPALAAIAALAVACGGRGALGQATLVHDCGPNDTTCRRATPAAPIAVGARLRPDVTVDVAGSVMPVVVLSSSRPDILEVDGGTLIGREPGMAAVLISTSDGTVIDFQHVWVARPTAIVVERPATVGAGVEELTGPLQLVAGEQLMLSSAMVGGAQRLAGDGELEWSIDPGGVTAVSLLRDGSTGRRRLVARAPGAARITVAALGISTTVSVEVVP